MNATNLVERLRAIKAPQEIAYLRTAADLSRAGLVALTQAIAPGMDANRMTEIEDQILINESGVEVMAASSRDNA